MNSKNQPIVYGITKLEKRDLLNKEYQLVKVNWETGKAQIIKGFYRINSYSSSEYVFTDDEQEYENAIQVRKDRHYNELIENNKYLTIGLWRLTPNTPIYDKVYSSIPYRIKYGTELTMSMDKYKGYWKSFVSFTYYGKLKTIVRYERKISD
jgi:hypothetical protein